MKIKKTLAAVAAAAMAATTVSAFSFGASAIASGTVIDFEDGDYSFAYMNVDAGADDSVLSVEDYDGSKQLKVDVQDCTAVPKVWFDLDKITDRSNTVQIKTIEMDLTLVPKNAEEAIGWAGGAIGTAGAYGDQVDPGWSDGQWSCEDNNAYTAGAAAKQHITRKILMTSQMFTETGASPFFGLMRWASETSYVMYIDNIVLKDKSGNPLPVGFAAVEETEAEAETEAPAEETEATAEETAAPAEETEAPAEETEAAPAEDADVDYSALTGDVISDTEATSGGAWGQAITLTTIKNENGVFDPAILTPDKAVVVYYEADTAPEVVLQSWSGGEGWAKVPANEEFSTDGVAVFTYDYMTAMYQSEDFVSTLDAFIVGDTGSELTVSKVLLVDAASLTAGAESDEEVIEDEAPAEEEVVEEAPAEVVTEAPAADTTTPVASTGNTAAASIAAVMALAGAAALISKRK
ncbi:MAG: hypothetical protein ACI4J0_02510 [Huintestinicola sp.]|uniref:hypothetical protein n=1 Tax=Huintestinicola sp. TaxID=2981661 RepID=UPI003F08157A